jgi:hypothetical protein
LNGVELGFAAQGLNMFLNDLIGGERCVVWNSPKQPRGGGDERDEEEPSHNS